jgi:hypothetical protein
MRQRALVAVMAAAGLAGAMAVVAAGPAAGATSPASARVTAAPGAWGKAALLPGTGKLGSGGVYGGTVSCPSSGNCTAGGELFDGRGPFVISERSGHWGTAHKVPGLAALNTGNAALLTEISCATPGNCVAAGSYTGPANASAWVAVQKGWRWSDAERIRGLIEPSNGNAIVDAVSCASPGNCTVGGGYDDIGDRFQAFVVTLRNGRWGAAFPVAVGLNTGGLASVLALSCRKAGDCSAAGYYEPSSTTASVFVISEQNGHWGGAFELPGLGTLNAGGRPGPVVLSCGSAGNCATGGSYRDAAGRDHAYLATQKNYHWGQAAEAPGLPKLDLGGNAQVTAIKCPSAGNCVAGGSYHSKIAGAQLFLISERAGTWGSAVQMPGIASHNRGSSTEIYSISCNSLGTCSAGGYYENDASRELAFVSTESGGHWGSVTEVRGIGAVSPGGDSAITQLSCPSSGGCVGVGYGTSAAHLYEAFYVRRT